MAESLEMEDEEWFEISDATGKRSAMRHLATLSVNGKTYYLLDAVEDDESGFLLVREDCTMDGMQEYVIADDEHEIEDVLGKLIAHTLSQMMDQMWTEKDEVCSCGIKHRPGEFCFCDDEDLLQ